MYKQSIRLPAHLVEKAKAYVKRWTDLQAETLRLQAEFGEKVKAMTEKVYAESDVAWKEIVTAVGQPNAEYRTSEWFFDTAYVDHGIAFLNQLAVANEPAEELDNFLRSISKSSERVLN